ncbi:MAG TPA: hypothetical protein DCW90_23625 [Lachnospiraceae bacterium]|nr:hypothetical protein [Lachnospiraceae bacterium]
MKAYDFEYDGLNLSDKGFMLCSFDKSKIDTVENGAEINMETSPFYNGDVNYTLTANYESTLTTTFQICKNPCTGEDLNITVDEVRDMASWLCRKGFHKFKIFDDDYLNVYYEATFNMSRIIRNGNVIGLELEMITNRPFGVMEDTVINIKNEVENGVENFYSISDDEGFIYPKTKITIKQDGDLKISNIFVQRDTIIKNCKAGEVIEMDYPVIKSSLESHKIQNDFNWNFFRIENKFKDKRNLIQISIPCEIEMVYSPIAKIGI